MTLKVSGYLAFPSAAASPEDSREALGKQAGRDGRGRKGGLREAAREASVARMTAQRRAGKLAQNEIGGPVSVRQLLLLSHRVMEFGIIEQEPTLW